MQGNLSPSAGKQAFIKAVSEESEKIEGGIEILQKAYIDANSVFVSDANADFAIADGNFSAYINSEHKEGDAVTLSMLIYGTERFGVVEIQAQEAQAGSALINQ